MKNEHPTTFISEGSLSNKLLIAVPGMCDDSFEKSVVYVCSNSKKDGSLGWVLNKKAPIQFESVLSQLGITAMTHNERSVLWGGPVDPIRGFILHSADFKGTDTTVLSDNISLTVSVDVLSKIANNEGPKESLVFLGYSSWAAGQLELEIAGNSWLVMDADSRFLFECPAESKWKKAFDLMGVNPAMFSSEQGSV